MNISTQRYSKLKLESSVLRKSIVERTHFDKA